MSVNPETGFLESSAVNSFSSDKKKQFLDICKQIRQETKAWPDFGKVCEALSITHTTFDRHLREDLKFKEEFRNLILGGKWQLESNLFNLAQKRGFEALIWLRRWFPEEYNPEYKGNPSVNVSVFVDNVQEKQTVIEADVVDLPCIDTKTVDTQ